MTIARQRASAPIIAAGLLRHVTAAYNRDGGLVRAFADVTLRNSIVAGDANFDTRGPLSAASANILTNVSASAARLGTPSDNGGATLTILPLPGSPAINGGMDITSIDVEQRGIARPQGSASDIGAVERAATAANATSVTFQINQRQAVTIAFNDDASVTLQRWGVTSSNRATGVPINIGDLPWNSSGTQATLVLANLLADGHYRVSVGFQVVNFFVLAGDSNRVRSANFDDLLTLTQNYGAAGQSNATDDVNYDGSVDFADLLRLAQYYRQALTAAPARGVGWGFSTKRKGISEKHFSLFKVTFTACDFLLILFRAVQSISREDRRHESVSHSPHRSFGCVGGLLGFVVPACPELYCDELESGRLRLLDRCDPGGEFVDGLGTVHHPF